MRITKEVLRAKVRALNKLLERPENLWNPGAAAGEQNVGHLSVDHNSAGYQLVETVSPCGGERGWSKVLSAGDLHLYLVGLVDGITLRGILQCRPDTPK